MGTLSLLKQGLCHGYSKAIYSNSFEQHLIDGENLQKLILNLDYSDVRAQKDTKKFTQRCSPGTTCKYYYTLFHQSLW